MSIVRSSSEKSTSLLLSHVETILNNNEQDVQEQTEELKEDYISYAQSIVYITSKNPEVIYDIDELNKIAELQHVDEIHIFDETGTIISGTVPKYYGYSFDSGEQMGYFKPMLEDKTLTMCQDITPNTAEGKSMMYAIVWNQEGTQMVQVGIEPKRLLSELEENDIGNVIDNIPLTTGYSIFAVDLESLEIVAGTDDSQVGTIVSEEFKGLLGSTETHSGSGLINSNGYYYCNYKYIDNYIIAVVYSISNSSNSIHIPMIIIAIFLIIAGIIIYILFYQIYKSEEKLEKLNANLVKAKDEAEAANQAKTSFLFNMSHDIRTPMNAIMGFRDLLEKHQEDPEKRSDYLKKIQDSSTVLLSIINNVLEMARIEKGTLVVDETAWNTEHFNDTIYSVFDEMMVEKGLTFTRQINVENHYVYCDPIKLREIFINIISNAYKYTNPGGSVNMLLEEIPYDREGWVLYRTTISDTGIGMSEEFLPHIFEEFSREKNTTDAKIEGTGLGMPIVKRLVEILDGTIEIKSKKGEGSTFIVTIPHRIADKSDMIEQNGVEIDPKLFVGKRILLAEDNDLNAEIAIEILNEAGLIVERAEDGAICVDMLKNSSENYYDLILMDIQMPNMNGYEATKAIRQLEDINKATIMILAMTANAFEEDKREALKAGMNGHLAKPINVNELIETLASVLN